MPNGANIRSFKLKPDNTTKGTELSAHELQDKILQTNASVHSLLDNLRNVVFKSSPSTLSGRLVVDQIEVRNANMDSVIISKLNGQSFDPKNILMYSKDQKLTGTITANKMVADTIAVGSLNNIKIEGKLIFLF